MIKLERRVICRVPDLVIYLHSKIPVYILYISEQNMEACQQKNNPRIGNPEYFCFLLKHGGMNLPV